MGRDHKTGPCLSLGVVGIIAYNIWPMRKGKKDCHRMNYVWTWKKENLEWLLERKGNKLWCIPRGKTLLFRQCYVKAGRGWAEGFSHNHSGKINKQRAKESDEAIFLNGMTYTVGFWAKDRQMAQLESPQKSSTLGDCATRMFTLYQNKTKHKTIWEKSKSMLLCVTVMTHGRIIVKLDQAGRKTKGSVGSRFSTGVVIGFQWASRKLQLQKVYR